MEIVRIISFVNLNNSFVHSYTTETIVYLIFYLTMNIVFLDSRKPQKGKVEIRRSNREAEK